MSKDASPKTIYLKEYREPDYRVSRVSLDFQLHDDVTRVEAVIDFYRNETGGSGNPALFLNGEELKLLEIFLDGELLPAENYQLGAQGLLLHSPPEKFQLKTLTEIHPETNTALEGLYRSGKMFCSQCEAEGFRKITWFPDRPDIMASFTTRIEADRDKYPVLLSNGNPVEQGQLPDGRHYAVWDDPFPKPCYLFALVAGDLEAIHDQYVTVSGRCIDLNIYVESENIDKCDHAMVSLKNAMRWDEENYGREYDLDIYNIVAVNDFNMGAMENKGLNVFNSKYVLARPETATDRDFQGIEGVIAHEYFHNWTGNRITCRDWFQLSLKEGFTVYRDQSFSADMGSAGVKRIEDVRLLRAHQFAEDAGPMAHPVRPASYIEINNFYTVTVYEKGAEVVRMQANLLGPETFRKATDLYFQRFDGKAVTTEDFVQCMEEASGRDLTQFRHWYDYAGTPEIRITDEYDAGQQVYRLSVSQHCPDTPGQENKPAFLIPFRLGLLDRQGRDMELQLQTASGTQPTGGDLEISERQTEFVFENITEKPVPSLFRGFSAPVRTLYDYSDDDLMFLMAHDSDGFNRWDAAQTLSQRLILGMVERHRMGEPMSVNDGYIAAFRRALLDENSDPALIAEVLSLPSESYLGDQMAVVDVDGIFLARETLRTALAEALFDDLMMVYEARREAGDYQVTPAAIAGRSLKNTVLSFLAAGGRDEAMQLCLNQYGDQHNMTDVIAALSLLADSEHHGRQAVLDDFEQRWQHDVLVMDKWFTVQAVSRRQDSLQQVRKLMQHKLFSIKNPNKVRALVGAFCSANPVRFHAVSGEGYEFLTDQVLRLDELNPQVASRMLRIMSRWQQYDEPRQKLMQQQLQRIVALPSVSRDVYEIASKSLADSS